MELDALSQTSKEKSHNSNKVSCHITYHDVIIPDPICVRSGAIQKLDSTCMVHDPYFLINNNLLPNKSC